MPTELQQAVGSLVVAIGTYESDTFSSTLLTGREIILIAAKMIQNMAENAGCSDGFDGDDLTKIYNQIKEEAN